MHCHWWKHFCKGSLSICISRITSSRSLKLLQILQLMECEDTSLMLMMQSLKKQPWKPRYRHWKYFRTFCSATAKWDSTCSVWRSATLPHVSASLQDCQEKSSTHSTICQTQYQMVTTTRTLNNWMETVKHPRNTARHLKVRGQRRWNAFYSNCAVCQERHPHNSVPWMREVEAHLQQDHTDSTRKGGT